MLDELEGAVREYSKPVERTCRRCFAIAVRQPLDDLKSFTAGFNEALARGTVSKNGKLVGATSATEFHTFIVALGTRVFEFFGGIPELHAFLVRFWGQRAGDIKTTEKRCQRIGLSFAGKRSTP